MATHHDTDPRPRPSQPDEIDQLLLNRMQADFPLTERPFAALAEACGTDEADVLARVTRLKEGKLVRQISAIFDSRRLGYATSLVAMKFTPETLDAGAAIISLHPGVSHNYERRHRYNLWFTIATPPDKTLEAEVEALARKAKPEQTWLLPTIKLYKIGVNLDTTGQLAVTATESEDENIGLKSARNWSAQIERPEFTPAELTVIRALQRDLPLVEWPFAALAEGTGVDEGELLAITRRLLEANQLRRFAAVLHHRQAGFRANVMAVWEVPLERIEEVGEVMASFKAVSHCYRRPTYPDWPYSMFTMIHGHHKDECEAVVEAIREATGIDEYALLYSGKEYKKTRVRYFLDDDEFDVESLPERA